MANEYGLFFNSDGGDRTYDADDFAEWLHKFFTTGVFNGDLFVEEDSGMNIKVGTGYANIEGKVRFFSTPTSFTVPAANSTYPRIDTVVCECDYTNRLISLKYIQGSYSGSTPSATPPVRTGGVYQLVLAQINVQAGATEITQSKITDTRTDSDLCGIVTGTVEEISFDEIIAQWETYVNEFTTEQLNEFEEWFDHMKDQLSEDAAGHLQLEIDDLGEEILTTRDAVLAEIAKGSLGIDSRVFVTSDGDHLKLNGSGGILAVHQTVKISFS